MFKDRAVRALLIEDDEDDYIITRDVLDEIRGSRVELDWIARFDQALPAILRAEHDVYLLDYRLGASNGLDLLRQAIAQGCRAPIILLTGQDDHEIDVAAMEAGAADYLVKERFDALLLERSIRYAIERSQSLGRLRQSQEQFASFMRNLPGVAYMKDAGGRYVYFNHEFERIFGTALGPDSRPTDEEMFAPEVAWQLREHDRQALESGPMQAVEIVPHQDGLHHYLVAKFPVSAREGKGTGGEAAPALLGGVAIDITERVKAEAALETRLRYETELAACSQALLNESSPGEAVAHTLGRLQRASGASRVYIFENFSDAELGLCMRQTHEACAAGVPPEISNPELGLLPYSSGFERWHAQMKDGRHISGPVQEFPLGEREILEPQGILSMLVLPIRVRGAWWGFIGFDDVWTGREWSEADAQWLRTAAEMIGAYLERKISEAELRRSEERYALAASGANDGLWDWDVQSNSIYFSPRWKTMLGFEEDEISSRPDEWWSRVHPADLERLHHEIFLHAQGLTAHFESEYRMLHADGGYRWILSRGLAVRLPSTASTCSDTPGALSEQPRPHHLAASRPRLPEQEMAPLSEAMLGVVRMAGSQTDVTERKQHEEELLRNAFYDALTGLPNRALFMDRLGHALDRSRRRENHRFAVLFLDLDGFKTVNDSLGHMQGDHLLVAAAQRLGHCLRAGDTLARLGGDEFTILLDDISDQKDATLLAMRLQAALARPFVLDGHEVFVGTSIGITFSHLDPLARTVGYERPEELLRDADTAMYRAKAAGKGCYRVFDVSMHARALSRLRLESSLRRAIEREEFVLHYQPVISLRSNLLRGFESLVRWRSPDQGLVPPDEFIPLAEETGLIVPLGRWALREACRQTAEWLRLFPTPNLVTSVNLSQKQFLHAGLLDDIRSTLDEFNLDARHLKLEITESLLAGNTESAAALLREMKGLRVSISMDDFGTGYSSLAALHRFPLDTLKIDRSFIARVGAEGENFEIVRAIIALAHSLKMDVIGEGVESAHHRDHLRDAGCEAAQGYFFSKPLSARAATAYLAAACSAPLDSNSTPLPSIIR